MISKRELRRVSASVELGQRHPYLFGLGAGVILGALAAGGVLVALLWGWIFAPAATLNILRGVATVAIMGAGLWLFWRIALRRRRGSVDWRDYS